MDLLQDTIRRVWAYNVDRHSPGDIGDTNRSLGVTTAENVRTLVTRAVVATPRRVGLGSGVAVSSADNSLLVRAGGVRLRVVKAPPRVMLAEPRWAEFDWTSEVRSVAARNNHDRYVPVGVDDLFQGAWPAQGSVDFLHNVFLVWAGGLDSPRTAGWLGFPVVDDSRWLAVEPLWWDQPGQGSRGQDQPRAASAVGDTFSSRVAPQPAVALKQQPREQQQEASE